MRTLSIDGLVLEPQVATHADEMFTVLSDPAIYQHENEPPPSVEWLRSRFKLLERRTSADGREHWLNWVVRVPGCGLIGYVQATVRLDCAASIAYEFSSTYWGRGFASKAVQAMIQEIASTYQVRIIVAILKTTNLRSHRFLVRLGFVAAPPLAYREYSVEPDELLMFLEVCQ